MRLDFFILILVGIVSSTVSIIYYTLNAYFSVREKERSKGNSVLTGKDVTVIIPVYNEDPEIFERSLSAIRRQTGRVIVVSDGNEHPYRDICERNQAEFILKRERTGKRDSLGIGMERVDSRIVILMDADTVPNRDAVEKVLREFDENTGGVGANIFMDTSEGNLVAYASEFLERSKETVQRAMSRFGNIMLIDGSFATYRTEVIKEYVTSQEFRNFRIRGEIPYYGGGDDTSLTSYTIRKGYRVAKAFDAHVMTVPKKTIKSFAKQNLRWSRTAWRTFFANIRNGTFKRSNKFYVMEQFLTFSIPVLFLILLAMRAITFSDFIYRRGLSAINPLFLIERGVGDIYMRTYTMLSLLSTTSSFLFLATVAGRSIKERLKTIAYGSIGAAILFITSIYAMFTFTRS